MGSIKKMCEEFSDDQILEQLDDFGDGQFFMHEVAKRLRAMARRIATLEVEREEEAQQLRRTQEYAHLQARHLDGTERCEVYPCDLATRTARPRPETEAGKEGDKDESFTRGH